MTARRFSFPVLLACTVAASLTQAAFAAEVPFSSLTEMLGLQPVLGEGGDASGLSDGMTPPIRISADAIPPNGLTFGADGSPRGADAPACQIFTSLAQFTTAFPCGFAKPCAGSQCLENFDNGTANAGLGLCTTGADLNCNANACMPAGGLSNGLALREFDLERDGGAPVAQTGFLQAGPNWFGNRKDPSGKAVTNNFFNDSSAMYFTGDPRVPANCVGATTAPTVVGFDAHNWLNAAVHNNVIQVLLANGDTFVWQAEGRQSGRFTGICCSGVQIRRIVMTNVGDFTEGFDNIRYGNCAGTCTPPSGGGSVNCDTSKLETLACNLLRLEHTPDGQKQTSDQIVQDVCKTTYSWNGTSSCGPQGLPEPVSAPDPCGGQCKGTSETKPGCP